MSTLGKLLSGLWRIVAWPWTGNAEDELIIGCTFPNPQDITGLDELEDRLAAALAAAGVGEMGATHVYEESGEVILFSYGPDAQRLLEVAKPILESLPFMHNARLLQRFAKPRDGLKEISTTLTVQAP